MINFFYHWRGGQAVRQESAKLLYAGAIPAHASSSFKIIGNGLRLLDQHVYLMYNYFNET